jgi:hypothetical protein
MTRPSEAITAVVGTIVGAGIILLDEFAHVAISARAAGAVVILLSYGAAGVTWVVARRQRAGTAVSDIDGSVKPMPRAE